MSDGQAKPKLGELLESIKQGMEEFKTEMAIVKEMVSSSTEQTETTESTEPTETEPTEIVSTESDDSIVMSEEEIKELDNYFNES